MTDEELSQLENFYKILKCDQTASYDQLKSNYQKLIREFHPDKQQTSQNNNFILVDKAWKVLRDETLRKKYDASLLQDDLTKRPLIYAEVKKENVKFNENNEALYPCRCGNDFIIYEEYLEVDECIVECSECSNCIAIK